MKCGDFRLQVLQPAAELLDAGGSAAQAQALRSLAAVLDNCPSKTVSVTVKRLENLQISTAYFSLDAKIVSLNKVLLSLGALLKGLAKQPAAKDVDLIREVLSRYEGVSIDAFASAATVALTTPPTPKKPPKKPVRDDLVERYRKRLEEALGDAQGFAEVYARMSDDPEMGASEVSLLARRFAMANAKGRDAALKKIFGRQQALMTSRARSAATAGRVAG